MKLFANGCSFTFGGGQNMYNNNEIDERTKTDIFLSGLSKHPINLKRLSITWPTKLAELLGAESAINLSQGGSGNARIVRTTLDYFYDVIDRGEDPRDYFVVIQWSEILRRELFDGEHWCNINPNFSYFVDYTATDWLRKGNKKPKETLALDQARIAHYKHIQSHEQDLSDFFMQVTALGGFFNQLGIPYLFCTHLEVLLWAVILNDDFDESTKTYWFNKIKHLERMYRWFGDEISKSAMIDYDLDPCAPGDAHPSVQGHQQFANILHNWIQQKDLLGNRQ